jgi:hypothetical protein
MGLFDVELLSGWMDVDRTEQSRAEQRSIDEGYGKEEVICSHA